MGDYLNGRGFFKNNHVAKQAFVDGLLDEQECLVAEHAFTKPELYEMKRARHIKSCEPLIANMEEMMRGHQEISDQEIVSLLIAILKKP